MGRPREHDETTAEALLTAAELLLRQGGSTALSLREVAVAAETTTRAVYSVFGSKEGLLAALGARAMLLLHTGLDELAVTNDPYRDLVEAGLVFRRFALDHPALFDIAFHRADPGLRPQYLEATTSALAALAQRFEPLAARGLLGGRSVREAVTVFHALCEGMASIERRGLSGIDLEALWRDGLWAQLTGLANKP